MNLYLFQIQIEKYNMHIKYTLYEMHYKFFFCKLLLEEKMT